LSVRVRGDLRLSVSRIRYLHLEVSIVGTIGQMNELEYVDDVLPLQSVRLFHIAVVWTFVNLMVRCKSFQRVNRFKQLLLVNLRCRAVLLHRSRRSARTLLP
jgi:hypothetical protein